MLYVPVRAVTSDQIRHLFCALAIVRCGQGVGRFTVGVMYPLLFTKIYH